MNKKICSTCEKLKPLDSFFIDRSRVDGLSYICKECKSFAVKKYREKNKDAHRESNRKYSKNNKAKIAKYHKKYYAENKEMIAEKSRKYQLENREKSTARMAKWRAENRDEHDKKNKLYREKNKESIKLKAREYYQNNKGMKNEYMKMRRRTDPNFKIMESCRTRIRLSLKAISLCKNKRTIELIGCDVKEYKEYLESLFLDGMNWDNYGKEGWHIDHIRPIASFDLTDMEQQKQCFNHKNTQPLWAIDNLKKGSKVIP